jgi:hypothetical protein
MKFEASWCPPYSSNIVLFSFHFLGLLKEVLRVRNEVKKPVQECLKAELKTFYYDGGRKLLDCWTEYIEQEGDCIEA